VPSNPPYIPARDVNLSTWLTNFSTLLTAAPNTYGQTSGTAATVAAANASFQSAYALVTSKSTKTADAVAAKNSAKLSTLATVRAVAQAISKNAGVAASDKTAIGVNPNTSKPSPITPPSTYPILLVQGAAALQLYLRYRDSAASPSVKSKPYGVQFVNVFYQLSSTPITTVAALLSQVQVTKSPYLLQFPSGSGGQQCYLAGQYLLKNGKLSGFGPIVSFTVPLAS
jgi:hypothetical protein